MTSSVHFWSSPVRPTGRIWRRSCTSATDSVPLILKHMVEDGRLVQAGQRYALPIREEVLL